MCCCHLFYACLQALDIQYGQTCVCQAWLELPSIHIGCQDVQWNPTDRNRLLIQEQLITCPKHENKNHFAACRLLHACNTINPCRSGYLGRQDFFSQTGVKQIAIAHLLHFNIDEGLCKYSKCWNCGRCAEAWLRKSKQVQFLNKACSCCLAYILDLCKRIHGLS